MLMMRTSRPFSQVEEDYLKAIFLLHDRKQAASTMSLSRQMGTTPAAVTKTLKNLAERNLIDYTPYYGASLTSVGERVALEVIRHHRLIELYLHDALGYSWDEVDAEAERLEHHISEAFESRIEIALDYPSLDPHGHPIPTRDGIMPPAPGFPLSEALNGETMIVSRVDDRDPAQLRYLSKIGIGLGTPLQIVSSNPKAGIFTVLRELGNGQNTDPIELNAETAKAIFVEPKSGRSSEQNQIQEAIL